MPSEKLRRAYGDDVFEWRHDQRQTAEVCGLAVAWTKDQRSVWHAYQGTAGGRLMIRVARLNAVMMHHLQSLASTSAAL